MWAVTAAGGGEVVSRHRGERALRVLSSELLLEARKKRRPPPRRVTVSWEASERREGGTRALPSGRGAGGKAQPVIVISGARVR